VTLLPPLDEQQALESAALRSVAGEMLAAEQFFQRPIRSPHHTSSAAAVIGGVSAPRSNFFR